MSQDHLDRELLIEQSLNFCPRLVTDLIISHDRHLRVQLASSLLQIYVSELLRKQTILTPPKIKLNFSHPIRELVWVLQNEHLLNNNNHN